MIDIIEGLFDSEVRQLGVIERVIPQQEQTIIYFSEDNEPKAAITLFDNISVITKTGAVLSNQLIVNVCVIDQENNSMLIPIAGIIKIIISGLKIKKVLEF